MKIVKIFVIIIACCVLSVIADQPMIIAGKVINLSSYSWANQPQGNLWIFCCDDPCEFDLTPPEYTFQLKFLPNTTSQLIIQSIDSLTISYCILIFTSKKGKLYAKSDNFGSEYLKCSFTGNPNIPGDLTLHIQNANK